MKNIFTGILFLCVISNFAQKNPYKLYRIEEYNLAIELFNKKEYRSAANIFYELSSDQNFKDTRRDITCKYYYALCEVYSGQKNSAKILQKFLKENKNEVDENDTYYMIGKFYYDNLDFKSAQIWYQKVDKFEIMDDRKDDLLFEMGFSQYKNKDYYKSKPNLYMASKYPKYKADATYYYSHMAYEDTMYVSALENMEKIKTEEKYIEIVPKYEVQMYFLNREYKKAIQIGREILDSTDTKDKEYIELSRILGDCYFEIGDYENAAKCLEVIKENSKFSNKEYYILGYSYYAVENYKKAIENLSKIISEKSGMGQNAYYYLSDSYLKEGKKVQAFNAFKVTSEMDFDTVIKKDAFYNYAKLSYDIGNPYEGAIEIISKYIAQYSNYDEVTTMELKNLIVSAYILNDEYEEAIKYAEENKNISHNINDLIQEASFKKGLELVRIGMYDEAISYFDKSIELGYNLEINNRVLFWRGECYYKKDDYKRALLDFKEFALAINLRGYYEYKFLNYNLGYIYFNLKDFHQALSYFTQYENEAKDSIKLDAILRIADCNFGLENYRQSYDYYKKYVDHGRGKYDDYAQYNIAICLGLMDRPMEKIDKLRFVISKYPNSNMNEKAHYELGLSYLTQNDPEQSTRSFEELEQKFPYGELVSKARLKKALIHYNQDKTEKSIDEYKGIIDDYPNSPESIQAMKNLRKIYVESGNIDDYIKYSESVKFVDFSQQELDSVAFFDAEQEFTSKQFEKAVTKLIDYKKRFPNGIFSVESNFYLAECLYSLGKKDESIEFYNEVLKSSNNTYLEKSSKKLVEIYSDKGDNKKIILALESLQKSTSDFQTINYTEIEICKSYYRDSNYTQSYEYAKKILENHDLKAKDKNIISFILARSSFKIEKFEEARQQYDYLLNNSIDEEKAECMYYKAYFEFEDKNYNNVISIVSKMGEEVPEYKFWGGKALIIMAKSFHNLEDDYQANYILESVISNIYYDEIQRDAKEFLEQIKNKEEEKKDNEDE